MLKEHLLEEDARNLRDEKRRIISGLRGGGIAKRGKGIALKKGGHGSIYG